MNINVISVDDYYQNKNGFHKLVLCDSPVEYDKSFHPSYFPRQCSNHLRTHHKLYAPNYDALGLNVDKIHIIPSCPTEKDVIQIVTRNQSRRIALWYDKQHVSKDAIDIILKVLNDIDIENAYVRSLRGQPKVNWCMSFVTNNREDQEYIFDKICEYQLWGSQWNIRLKQNDIGMISFSYNIYPIYCIPTQRKKIIKMEKVLFQLQLIHNEKVHNIIFIDEHENEHENEYDHETQYNLCDVLYRNILQMIFENPYRQDLSEFELEQKIKYDLSDHNMSSKYKIRSSDLLPYIRHITDGRNWRECVSIYGINLLPLHLIHNIYKKEYERSKDCKLEFDFIFRSSAIFKQLIPHMKNKISKSYEDPPSHLVEILEKYKNEFDNKEDDEEKEKYLNELDSCDEYKTANEQMKIWHDTRVEWFHKAYKSNYIVPYNI